MFGLKDARHILPSDVMLLLWKRVSALEVMYGCKVLCSMVQHECMTDTYLTRARQTYLRVQTGIWLVGLQEIMQALVIDLHIAHAYPAVLPVIW